jgi:hypothetical protein
MEKRRKQKEEEKEQKDKESQQEQTWRGHVVTSLKMMNLWC